MQYIDERVVFDFVNFTTTYDNTVYRYDVLIDSEIVFVGNIFVESNTKPVIDITEILRNYYDTHIVYSSTPTKSNIIREVSVSLYNSDQTDEETITDKIVFIYRQPNYNSSVSTPITENHPLLQGWLNGGVLLPTYPKVSDLDFEYLGVFGDGNTLHSYSVNYPNGVVDKDIKQFNISDAGAVSYSIKMDDLVKGISGSKTEVVPSFRLARMADETYEYWQEGITMFDGVFDIEYIYRLKDTNLDIDNMRVYYSGSQYHAQTSVVQPDANGVITFQTVVTTDRFSNIPNISNGAIEVRWCKSGLSESETTKVRLPLVVDLLNQRKMYMNGTYKITYTSKYNTNTGLLWLTMRLDATTNYDYNACDAIDIQLVTESEGINDFLYQRTDVNYYDDWDISYDGDTLTATYKDVWLPDDLTNSILQMAKNTSVSQVTWMPVKNMITGEKTYTGSFTVQTSPSFSTEYVAIKLFLQKPSASSEQYLYLWINEEMLAEFVDDGGVTFTFNMVVSPEGKLTFTVQSSRVATISVSTPIANLDGNSRYFLKWRDRYGMTQIQPFKGTYTYSENTTKSTITNYKNIKRLTDVAVNSKWKLNSDWISESLYPYYESIFVSPWLQLYDSKEDKVYSVIITDTEYTEKTFKNQNRSLFNLQLEVELDSTQTIIY